MSPEEEIEVEKVIDCALNSPEKYKYYFTLDDITLLAKKIRELQHEHHIKISPAVRKHR